MKVLKLLAVASAITASGFAMADSNVVKSGYAFEANQLIPSGIRAEIGTTGAGAALLWTANPYVGLALGWNGGDISWSDDLSINGSKYDLDMDNNVAYLNAEVRPWGASENRWAQGLYVAAGVGYIDTDYGVDRKVKANETFSVDGNKFYDRDGVTRISGKVNTQNDIAPYVGIGWAPKINKNWGVFGEIGAYYTENPNASLNSNNNALLSLDGSTTLDSALREEERDIENKNRFEWLPVGKVGISFNW